MITNRNWDEIDEFKGERIYETRKAVLEQLHI